MKLLVVTDKWSTRFFIPDEGGSFLSPFIRLVRERLRQNMYENQFKEQAQELVDRYSRLGEVFGHPDLMSIEDFVKEEEELLKAVTKFLEKRRRYEYEEWEICTTEN